MKKFLSTNEIPRAIIYITHGMAEHIGRYKWFIQKLNQDNFHVIAYDHRGHGEQIKKGKLQGHFANKDGWVKVVNDLQGVIINGKTEFPNSKHILFAHSMGSWIAISAMLKGLKVDGVILSGSNKLNTFLAKFIKTLTSFLIFFYGNQSESNLLERLTIGTYNKKFAPNRTPSDWISSDPLNVDDYVADPLCGFKKTLGLWNDFAHGMIEIFDEGNYTKFSSQIPLMLISGNNDPVGGFGEGVNQLNIFLQKFYKKTECYIIENEKHEVLSGLKKEEAYSIITRFILKHV